jgi:hypothetical protein
MASILTDAERRPAARNNGLLNIEPRALVSDQHTIAISHVVTMTTGATKQTAARRMSRWSMTLIFVAPLAALAGIAAYSLVVTPMLLFTALVLLTAAYQLPRVDRERARFQYYLRITTSDGRRVQFIESKHGGSLQTVLIRTTRPQSTPSISTMAASLVAQPPQGMGLERDPSRRILGRSFLVSFILPVHNFRDPNSGTVRSTTA